MKKVVKTISFALLFSFVLCLGGLLLLIALPPRFAPPKAEEVKLDEKVLWDEIQNWRKSQNLPEYQNSVLSCGIAKMRIQEASRLFDHTGNNAKRFCTEKCTIGENLARGFSDEKELFRGWLDSPIHKDILEKEYYQYSCLAIDKDIVVHIFSDK